MLSADEFAALVMEANLAPSVHNTQPTRWRLEPDGRVLVLEAQDRLLPIGDPERRDTGVSHGAAIEGFALACAARATAIAVAPVTENVQAGLRAVALLTLSPSAPPDALSAAALTRRTYRGAFARADAALLDRLEGAEDIQLVRSAEAIAHLAQINDEASLRFFRNRAYRAELLSWMRLSRANPRYALDGLNADAMEMSPLEAVGAGFVLKPDVFEALDRFGAAGAMVSEAKVVRSASAVALFHRPEEETPLETGRHFHRFLLELTAAGLSASPMAVLADDPAARDAVRREFRIASNRRLITAFRIGVAPTIQRGPKPRLPVTALLA